jgi:hypothetical protein
VIFLAPQWSQDHHRISMMHVPLSN